MNQQQATARAEQIVRDTASALHPEPGLDFNTSLPNETGPCLAENLPSADKMVQASRTAELSGVRDSQQIIAIANQVQAYWKKQGYVISSTANFTKGQPAIFGHTPEHDPFAVFTISLETNPQGSIAIGATSPCIWPSGTPPANS